MPRAHHTRRSFVLGAAGLATALAELQTAPAAQERGSARSAAARAAGEPLDELVARLTLDEKISLLHGSADPVGLAGPGQAGYVPGVPRLGIPELRLTDGPQGIRLERLRTSALPAPLLLASAFSPDLARTYGEAVGHEGRALGMDILLGPTTNLIRTPYSGRNFETYSEDPLLAADLVAAQVQGIQSQGMIATVKHFAFNNQETDRQTYDAHVDEQTAYEMELRPFAAAVAAGVGAVDGAYNKVNGQPACESKTLLTDILRDKLGFTGWVMTDWAALRSTGPALAAGLDMEMPLGRYFGDELKRAVKQGALSEALVDRSVSRILTVRRRFGLIGRPAPRPRRDRARSAKAAYDVAVAGAVLLRNTAGTLPLDRRSGRSLAVIGPTAARPLVSGGGSAHVVPEQAQSPLDALRRRAGSVRYEEGVSVFGSLLPTEHLTPPVSLDRTGQWAVPAGDKFRYDGSLRVDRDDEWTFILHFSGPPQQRPTVALDGTELFPQAPGLDELNFGGMVTVTDDGLIVRRSTVRLTAGEHRLRIDAPGGADGKKFRLCRVSSATRAGKVAAAVAAAKAADTAVVFAYKDATEGEDVGSLALPDHQDELINAVVEANPATVVVLNTAGCATMPWLEKVRAVLQMYFPGQEGGRATADLLYGHADPSGRLTLSYPASDQVHAMAGDRRRYPGVNGIVEQTEGIRVGYRWFDAEGREPLLPFGHGMTYTTFDYSRLSLAPRSDGGVDVAFTLTNTGRRSGTEVVQVYAGPSPDLHLPQAVRALAGYQRVRLAPGAVQRVHLTVTAQALSSWSPTGHAWVLGTGRRTISVGASSRDLRLSGPADIRRR